MARLLFEIGTEEIPANFMKGILGQLEGMANKKLQDLRIPFEQVRVYGTPRRLVLVVENMAQTQEDMVVEAKGPSVKIAYLNGEPSKAAQGFARGQGVDVKALEVREGYVYAVKHLAGQSVEELLPGFLNDIIVSFSFPKTMRWADHEFRFVRPIHWLVALFGKKLISVEINGVKSDYWSRGHRFLKGELSVKQMEEAAISALTGQGNMLFIPSADEYERIMDANYVMVNQEDRKAVILQQVTDLARNEGGEAQIKEDLLEEVTYLVEWPTALCGKFEEKFLDLPKECIITPMREHQRYFPVLKEDGSLLNKFITVRNGGDKYINVVAHGNERVLRARLSDAEFFFKEDRKLTLEQRLPKLATVSFQEGLGNMQDKSRRLVEEAEFVAKTIGVKNVDSKNLDRTALLCKTDLVSGMVVEFTELQGVMGREYAKLDGEAPEVSLGIFEHYLPRFAGDNLPKSTIGRLVGISDKLDNIVATFSRGLAPTGSQDPYALRRQALGVINILIDADYHCSLRKVLGTVAELLNVPDNKIPLLTEQVLDFIKQRLKNMMMEQKIRYDVVDAVLDEKRNDDIADLYKRSLALQEFLAQGKSAELVQAAVRVNNLCKKIENETAINENLFQKDEERELQKACLNLNKEILPFLVDYQYVKALETAMKIVPVINKFFDEVMVMDKDVNVKDNRLALLAAVQDITNNVGNLSCIVG